MANRYSVATGLASAVGTWDGGASVPVTGDRVLISSGHTVTLDGNYEWGDDSTATIVVNAVSTTASIFVQGTLKASRTVSSQLTCNGQLEFNTGGALDFGTEVDPIPNPYTAFILPNKSAAMANGKYWIATSTGVWGSFRMWGADKTPRTTMSAATATDTVLTVADATGWQIGDKLQFGATSTGAWDTITVRAITAIAGTTVTVGANLGAISASGRSVFNLTRNVGIKPYQGNTYRSCVAIQIGTASIPVNALELGNCEFNITGGGTGQFTASGLNIYVTSPSNNTAFVKKIYRIACNDVWSVSGSTVVVLPLSSTSLVQLFGNQAYKYNVEEPLITLANTSHNGIVMYSGASINLLNAHQFRANFITSSGFSQGAVSCTVTGGYFEAVRASTFAGSGISLTMTDVEINGYSRILDNNVGAFGSFLADSCTFGGALGTSNANSQVIMTTGYSAPAVFLNCTFADTVAARATANLNNGALTSYVFLKNYSNDVTNQKIYRRGGRIVRDNSFFNRGRSSLAFYPWYAGSVMTHQSTVSVGASASVRIVGYAQFNTTYATATPPTLTVSGMGITPSVFTCPATANTWHPIDITVTNPQSYPGTFTLDFTAQSAANTETATAWFDGIAMDDIVPWARHYGFLYDPSVASQEVDPVVVLSEASASALTGISYSTGTLTLTSNKTISEIYDWMQWYECSNKLDPIITSTDGISFSLDADLTLNGGSITGSGTLNLGANTFSRVGSESSSVVITYNSNAAVFGNITVSGLVANSRVRLNNDTDNIELYNAVVAGTSVTIPATWTTNKTLDLRVTNVIGTTAYLPYQSAGSLTSTMASFTVSQVADSVYNSNAINGSTVTEFIADYPNIQVDIDDVDGTTSAQRLYAFFQYATHSSQGIVYFFNGILAQDSANYKVITSVVDLYLDNIHASSLPIKITGAYIYRDDGATIIYSGSKSIQLDPSKAYIAKSEQIQNMVNLIPALL